MMARFVIAAVGSLLTAVYWWAIFAIVYADALFAGDRNPMSQPAPDHAVLTRNGLVLLAGVVGYALLMLLWRRLTTRNGRAT